MTVAERLLMAGRFQGVTTCPPAGINPRLIHKAWIAESYERTGKGEGPDRSRRRRRT